MKTVSLPWRAPSTAPVTGESTTETPGGAWSASERIRSPLLVDRSAQIDPGSSAASTPFGPAMSDSTIAGVGSEVNSTVAAFAHARADVEATAPCLATSAVRAGSRSFTMTS